MKNKILLAGLLFSHLFFLVNLRFTAWPEMISFPYLINHGFVLYRDTVHAYPPLLVSILAILFNVFGYKLVLLQIFGWTSILVSDVLVFLIVKKLTNKNNFALLSLIFYVSTQPFLEGNMVWPDINLIPFILCAFYLLLDKKYFWTGVSIALACLVKQTSVLYLVCSISYIAWKDKKYIPSLLTGVMLIILPFLGFLILQHSFFDFLNWTIVYPSKYWTSFPGYVYAIPSKHELLVIALLVLPGLLLFFRSKFKSLDFNSILIFLMFVAGLIGTYPRFSFFHFQPGFVFIVILTAYLVSKNKNAALIIFLYFVVLFIYLAKPVLAANWQAQARFYSEENLQLSYRVRAYSKGGDKIFLLGLPSNLYVLSDRLPPKPWIDNFGWYFEIPNVQEDMLVRWETDPPVEIFIKDPDQSNWYDLGVYRPKKVLNWITARYTKSSQIEPGIWLWQKK